MSMIKSFFYVLLIFPFCGLAQELNVKGRVTDSENNPLFGTSIQVKESQAETLVDEKGYYSVNAIKGNTLVFSFIGMETKEIVVNDHILNVVLTESSEQLDELVISFNKPIIEAEKAKITFNVANNASNSGISAFDLLKKIPGISIGQNDDILLKGNQGVNVMINGKMTYISGNQLSIFLKGLNSDDVNKVELITNPSASYDASGNSGIINIVTKKNNTKGYALNLRSSISKGEFWMNNQNITASLNRDKWNTYASFDFNTPHRKRNGTSGNSINENGENINLERSNYVPFKIYYYTWKVGGNLQFSPKHKIGLHYHGYFDDFSGTKTSDIVKKKDDGTVISKVYSSYQLTEPYHYDAFNIDYQFDIDSLGKKITADSRYISYRNLSDAQMIGNHYNINDELLYRNFMRTHQPGFIDIKSIQADADLPFQSINLKAGLKYAEVSNDNNFFSEEKVNNKYEEIPEMTDHFKYKEQIESAYVSVSKGIGNFEFDLGLRVEHTLARARLQNSKLNKKMEYTNLFPNLSVDYTLDNNNKLNFSLSRRINRPAYSELNPVRWYNDEYFYYYGNPELIPETAWLFSMSYVIARKYILTAEYSKRKNYISSSLSYDPNGISIRSQSSNFPQYDRFDLNIVSPVKIMNNWDVQVMGGLNYTTYPISELGKKNNLRKWGTFFSVQQQIKLPYHYSLDINAKYTSSELNGVYLMDDVFTMDLGIKRTFFDDRVSCAFSVNDIFDTYREKGISKSSLINYYYNTKQDFRRFSLTLQYNFGGKEIDTDKKKTEEQQRI